MGRTSRHVHVQRRELACVAAHLTTAIMGASINHLCLSPYLIISCMRPELVVLFTAALRPCPAQASVKETLAE